LQEIIKQGGGNLCGEGDEHELISFLKIKNFENVTIRKQEYEPKFGFLFDTPFFHRLL
jgi:hypothetical protein